MYEFTMWFYATSLSSVLKLNLFKSVRCCFPPFSPFSWIITISFFFLFFLAEHQPKCGVSPPQPPPPPPPVAQRHSQSPKLVLARNNRGHLHRFNTHTHILVFVLDSTFSCNCQPQVKSLFLTLLHISQGTHSVSSMHVCVRYLL